MGNSIAYKDQILAIGDMISLVYKIKEGEKERQQIFKGIIIRIKGADDANRMITIRKVSKSGIGIERIIPLMSPNIVSIKVEKKSSYRKAKLYFIRDLTETKVRRKLYSKK